MTTFVIYRPSPRILAWVLSLGLTAASGTVHAEAQPEIVLKQAPANASDEAQTKKQNEGQDEIVVRAKRLNSAQLSIQPSLGASTYTIPKSVINALPGGENASISELVLQAPGVAQDSFGQLHVRGDHNGIQYRLNGIILPEGLSSFGQVLSPRYADSVTLMDGALPAQYGLRTAAIINIKTKSGLTPGGVVSLYGGAHGTFEPSVTYGGSNGNDTAFGSLSYQVSQLGVESPYNTATPLHDRTSQLLGFGYYEHIIDAGSRLSLIAGVSDQRFQIPNIPGLDSVSDGAGFPVSGQSVFQSQNLNANQHEQTQYIIGSYLHSGDRTTTQVSTYVRTSSLDFVPAGLAEIAFNGISQNAHKADTALGIQAETRYDLTSDHILRAGLIAQVDRTQSNTRSQVLTLDVSGAPVSDQPVNVLDASRKTVSTLSLYVQDEWIILPILTVNLGLRYDQLKAYRNENQVSPRVNFVLKPMDGLTFHGGYARYFTPPPFELIALSSLQKFVGTSAEQSGQNDAAYAERDDYYDFGMVKKIGSNVSLGLGAYYRKSNRLLDEGQFGAPIILTPFNYQDGVNRGVELSFDYDGKNLSVYGNYALSSAFGRKIISSQFNFDPADLAYIADHYIHVDHDQRETASGGISYKLGTVKIAMDGIYGSGLRKDGDVPNGGVVKPYAQFNLSLAKRMEAKSGLLSGTEFRLDILNIFDRQYQIRDGSGIGVGAPQWGQRRGVFVGVSKTI